MPYNGSGVYSPPAASFPAVAFTTILSSKFNAVINDIASGLTTALTKDGQTVATANLPMGGFKHTNVADANARTQYATWGQLQDNTTGWCGTAGGTANALTLSPSPGILTYQSGQSFVFIAASTNTAAVTVAVSGIVGTKAIENNGVALNAGAIIAGKRYRITYFATAFQLEDIGADETNVFLYTSNQTLTSVHVGKYVYCSPTGSMNVTLPLTTAIPIGSKIRVKNRSTGAVILLRQGADLFDDGTTSYYVPGYSVIELVVISAGFWDFSQLPACRIGDIIMGGQTNPPTGWVECNGQVLSQTTYQGLFNHIGAAFNIGGEGGGNFRVPYMNGRSPVGYGQGNTAEGGGLGSNYVIGTQAGKETHTLDITQIPSHSHTIPVNGGGAAGVQAVGAPSGTLSTGSAGGGLAHENRGPLMGLKVWIKY